MPLFSYRALDSRGLEQKGELEADSPAAARSTLLDKGIYPLDVSEKIIAEKRGRKAFFKSNLPGREQMGLFTRQLATLVSSGVPLAKAIESISDQAEDGRVKTLLVTLTEDIKSGKSYAESLSKFPSLFPEVYVNIVRGGEETGTLDRSLSGLADFLEDQAKTLEKIKTALTYPILMTLIASLVVVFLMTFIVPRITSIFGNLGKALPMSTRILIFISGTLGKFWWLLIIAGIALYILFHRYYRSDIGRVRVDSFLLKIPIVGKLSHLVSIERFASTLSTLLGSGITMEKALLITAGTSGNIAISNQVLAMRDMVIEGASLTAAMKRSDLIPPVLVQMTGVGEESGNLDFMLKKAAEAFERDYDSLLTRYLSLLEPVIILFMGAVVAFIVISVMLPLLDLSQIIK